MFAIDEQLNVFGLGSEFFLDWNWNRAMIDVWFNLFYEQYLYNSLSFSHFFTHYKSPHDPKFILHAPFIKIKLKLCMTVIKKWHRDRWQLIYFGIVCTVSYLRKCQEVHVFFLPIMISLFLLLQSPQISHEPYFTPYSFDNYKIILWIGFHGSDVNFWAKLCFI